jgi:hypothetical protein
VARHIKAFQHLLKSTNIVDRSYDKLMSEAGAFDEDTRGGSERRMAAMRSRASILIGGCGELVGRLRVTQPGAWTTSGLLGKFG